MKQFLLILMTCALAIGLYAQQPCPGVPTVTDHEFNVYNTIKIGNQCWMKENLRTTTSPSTGTYLIPDANDGLTYTGKQARWYNNDVHTYGPMNYGLLYNWNAAVDTFNTAYGETSVNTSTSNAVSVTFSGHRRGICPKGWHLPSDDEWGQLTNYVGSVPGYQCGGSSSNIAKALASTTEWNMDNDACNVGNQQGSNNATGFSAVPAGFSISSSFSSEGDRATFWTSSQHIRAHAYYYRLNNNQSDVERDWSITDRGFSVRCLRDPVPVVNTGSVFGVTTTATCSGEVLDDGGFNVTARGICWSTSHNPTIADAHTSNGTGIGSFTGSITGLSFGTTYYVRAYATNSEGTTYGKEKSFTSYPPCPGTHTVTDYEGNVYNTVKIGNQCWMRQNLRTTKYADGTEIPADGSNVSYDEPYYYDYSTHRLPLEERGYLYNWSAAMHGASSSSANPSGVQGICPNGWHLPSATEWTQLTDYVSSQSEYTCGGESENIAKALASTEGWSRISNNCAVGNNQGTNNATGFSAVPAGYCEGGSSFNSAGEFNSAGDNTSFWSSTEDGTDGARNCFLSYFVEYVGHYSDYKDEGKSVRCLRNPVPVVNTGSVLGITTTTATCDGEVVDDGGFNVTARGICWSSSHHNPTVTDAHTNNGTGIGEFTGSITGLTPSTTYYVRAYATNSEGTSYGEEVSFTTELCALEDQCELTFVLTDSYGDSWNGNAILVKDAQTGVLLGYMTNEDMDGLYEPDETTTMPLAICNGRTVNFEWESGSYAYETSYTVYDGQGEVIFSGSGGFTGPISYTVSCASPCDAITLPYTENFDGYTQSTTAATGAEPTCWELVQPDVQMTDANRPQLYYKSDYAHSGKYSLLLNYRGVYAMPELSEDVSVKQVKLEMYLRQPKSYYALQVGVWEDNGTFVPVATFNNSGTGLEFVECDFSDYNGNGRRIAFRNISGDNTVRNYSYNYIDDINLTNNCEPITLPYTEDFDSYTASTTAATGVEPNCWNLVQPDVQMTDANRPQLYYKSAYAHSGNYSLLLNYRGVYAMPEISGETQIPINRVKLEMYVRQPKAYYQLEVGVWNGQMFVPVQRINNSTTEVEKVTVDFSGFEGWGVIAFRNVLADGYNYNYSYNYIDDITLTEIPEQVCGISELPYTESFDDYTQSTTAETGVQPNCWEVTHEDVALTNATKPQVYYNATYATSGSYMLRMKNRCVYALPELNVNQSVNELTMTFKLRQPKTVYRLQVGVVDAQGNFTSVKTINNSSTGTEDITVDFANYTGNGRRIAFRNTVSSSSTLEYSVNYIDNITLDITPAACGIFELPYSENFDDYTTSTTAETGVQPRCWEVVTEEVALTNATKPQVYYNATYATSGSYTLRMKNRCVYALPELNVNQSVNELTMTFKLRQPKAVYRLQVGVVDAQGNFTSVKTINNSSTNTEDITVDFANYTGNGRRIAFRNTVSSSSTLDYSVNYIDNIVLDLTPASCDISKLPYTENFDGYTQSTTAETGVQPNCWEVITEEVALTNSTKPQVYYNTTYATSGSYTLRMKNRCVYAMPELNVNQSVNELTMTFKLRQPKAVYRLQVGVVDAQGNFTSVKTINNASTNMEDITVDFANYTGNGRRIAFRNTVSSSSTLDYSVNYIDDITLVRTVNNKSTEVTDATTVDALAADRDQLDVVVYPNPTKDVVNVQCTMNNVQCSGIEIVDVYGKIITTVGTRFIASADSPASAQSPVQINVSGLAAGMYFVRVTTDRGVVTKPFVKR